MTTLTVRRIEADVGALLESRRGGELGQFERYADDPVAFATEVLHVELWARQAEIVRAVQQHPLVTVRSGNSCGKDFAAACLALWWTYAVGGYVLLTGPTDRQVVEIMMAEVRRLFNGARDLPGELFQRALRVEHRRGILAFTSSEMSRLTGFHAPKVLAVITEAQGVEDFAYESMLRCATGEEDRILAVGNPIRPIGRFFSIHRPDSAWRSIRIAVREHPNLTGGRFIPGGPTQAFVERIKSEYGEGSPIWQYSVAGEFPDQAEESLFQRRWLDDAVGVSRVAQLQQGGPRVFSLDVARSGVDLNCLVDWAGPVCRSIETWREADLMATANRVVQKILSAGYITREQRKRLTPEERRHPKYDPDAPLEVVVDTAGLGAGVTDRLRQIGWAVRDFNSSRRPRRQSERFLNERARAYWILREALANGDVALPDDEKLFEELLATEWQITAAGKIQIVAKAEIKSRLGRSPDRADAVVMGAVLALGKEAGRVARFTRPIRWSS